MDGDDSVGCGGVEGGHLGAGPLLGGQPVAGGRPHQVMGLGGQRALGVETLRCGQAGCQPPQCRGRRGGMDVHTGKVGGPVTDHAVELLGARRRGFRPARLVPAVRPDGSVGMGLRVFGNQLQTVGRRCGVAQIEAREREAGRGEVHVAVDECRCDEGAIEVDDVGVGKFGQADVVAAQPRNSAVTDGHRGGVRHGRAVDPATPQQGRQSQSRLRGGNASGSTSTTSITSPSM